MLVPNEARNTGKSFEVELIFDITKFVAEKSVEVNFIKSPFIVMLDIEAPSIFREDEKALNKYSCDICVPDSTLS